MPPSDPGDLPLFDRAAPANPATRAEVMTVTELNRRVRTLLESRFELLWVAGELSNVIRAASGHWYFSLKDRDAQVRCVMFRNRAAAVGFVPTNGMQVEVRAVPSLYEPRGEFQLGVEAMRRAGLGALYEAYERLKSRLHQEGLFAAERKRPLPAFPGTIGIVTSLKAAALQDVLTTLRRRAPMASIIVYPTAVQGAAAVREIAAALDAAAARREIDVLLVCRGGGSIEDLWSFNEEAVARAIVRFQDLTNVPVISGVGHETDFTIADFVADQRAPTPTAAAEMATPDVADLQHRLGTLRAALARTLRRVFDVAQQRIDRAARSLISPAERLRRDRDRLALNAAHLRHATRQRVESAGHQVALLGHRLGAQAPDVAALREGLSRRRANLGRAVDQARDLRFAQLDALRRALSHLDPTRVLERGYAIVAQEGKVLRDAAQARAGATIQVRLARGSLEAEVIKAHPIERQEGQG